MNNKLLIVMLMSFGSVFAYGQGTLSFELVESVDAACGPPTDCAANTVCFELRAQPSDFTGDAFLISYELSFCYDAGLLTYASDAACLINDGNDYSDAAVLGEYNVGGNSNISGPEILQPGVFTPIHTICHHGKNWC